VRHGVRLPADLAKGGLMSTPSPSPRLCEQVDALVDAAPIHDVTKPLWRAFGRQFGTSCLAAALDVAAVAAMARPIPPRNPEQPGRYTQTTPRARRG
jgi:hypothetical protein